MNPITKLFDKLWDCTSYKELRTERYVALLPFYKPSKGIPKVIWQTNHTKDLRTELLRNIDFMRQTNPDWQYQLYDDQDIEQYILEHYGSSILSYYQRISPAYGAAKADFFRYLLMYREGGVYLDIKTCATLPLDTLLRSDDQFILSFWDNLPGELHEGQIFSRELQHIERGEYIQWAIICSAGHPFMREVLIETMKRIDHYNPYRTGLGFWGTISTTGPVPYTLAIERSLTHYPDAFRWVDIRKDLGIHYSIYEQNNRSLDHKIALRTDYHKGKVPIIRHRFKVIEWITIMYLGLLRRYRHDA